MSKRSLLINRISMAQGAIALLDKNLKEALTLAEKSDKVCSITDDQEQERQSDLFSYDELFKGEFCNEVSYNQ